MMTHVAVLGDSGLLATAFPPPAPATNAFDTGDL